MIKIIKSGNMIANCPDCECKFTYDSEDILQRISTSTKKAFPDGSIAFDAVINLPTSYIICPWCGKEIILRGTSNDKNN